MFIAYIDDKSLILMQEMKDQTEGSVIKVLKGIYAYLEGKTKTTVQNSTFWTTGTPKPSILPLKQKRDHPTCQVTQLLSQHSKTIIKIQNIMSLPAFVPLQRIHHYNSGKHFYSKSK